MIDTATEAPATAASTNVVSRIDPHGWLYAVLVIVDVAKNAADGRNRHRRADGGVELGGRYQGDEEQADLHHGRSPDIW